MLWRQRVRQSLHFSTEDINQFRWFERNGFSALRKQPGNDDFRIEGVCLCGITAQPPHPEIHKTALGAEESVSWKYFEHTEDAVSWLKQQGYKVLAVEQCEGSTMLQDFVRQPKEKYAVVLGNEVKGVQQQVVDMCDGCLEIPQYGTKHSLNVSVTAGIVLWHLSKK